MTPSLPSNEGDPMTDAGTGDLQPSQPEYWLAGRTKWVIVGVVVVLAFFAAYGFAAARGGSTPSGVAGGSGGAGGAGAACTGAGGASSGACGGCESSAPQEKPQAAAVLENGVQRIDVDVSEGYYNPTIIDVAAGVPVEITFGQGNGCLAEVRFPDFDLSEDLTQGGAVLKLPALDPGEYGFNCGMEMVFGTVVAR